MRRLLMLVSLSAFLCAGLAFAETRHAKNVREFRQLTGFPQGRPGYIVDHRIPLCAGGADSVDNMQWQTRSASYTKDSFERALCRELRRQGYVLVKVPKVEVIPEPLPK